MELMVATIPSHSIMKQSIALPCFAFLRLLCEFPTRHVCSLHVVCCPWLSAEYNGLAIQSLAELDKKREHHLSLSSMYNSVFAFNRQAWSVINSSSPSLGSSCISDESRPTSSSSLSPLSRSLTLPMRPCGHLRYFILCTYVHMSVYSTFAVKSACMPLLWNVLSTTRTVTFEGNESSDRGSQEPGGVCGEGSR